MSFTIRVEGESDNTSNALVNIEPTSVFVIKTKVNSVQPIVKRLIDIENNSKFFINVCHDSQIPQPEEPFNPNIVYPLIMNNKWEIPIVVSSVRKDTDKKGAICYVSDCCINTNCMDWVLNDYQLKEILVEWCLESAEISESIELSREKIAFPKMKCKGNDIPGIQITAKELSATTEKRIKDAVEEETKLEPLDIIKKRQMITEENSEALFTDGADNSILPPLFPQNNDMNATKKPLIQELTSSDVVKSQDKKTDIAKTLPQPNFMVSIRKTKNDSVFKLRIEVESEIKSSSDLKIYYKSNTNEIVIGNTNINTFQKQTVKIPVPTFYNKSIIKNSKSFFIKKDKQLVLFL